MQIGRLMYVLYCTIAKGTFINNTVIASSQLNIITLKLTKHRGKTGLDGYIA